MVLSTDSEHWDPAQVVASLTPEQVADLPVTISEYEESLRPLRSAEPKLSGTLAKSVADSFASICAKMRPDMSPKQAGFWAAALVKAFADLPAFIVKAAIAEAIHIPFEFPTQMEAKVREIALRRLGKHQRALFRFREMQAQVERIAKPPQAVIEGPPVDAPPSVEEIRAMSAQFRRIFLAKGWVTQAQLDEADAQFQEQPQTGETR